MPRISVNTSLQMEPPVWGITAGLLLWERCSDAATNATQGWSGSVRVAAKPPLLDPGGIVTLTEAKPRASRCRCSAGMIVSASVPATNRNWQLATALGGMALTGRPGVPVVKARTLKTLDA